MAKKVNIVLVDDIDGTEADQTVSFALDGTAYEIDLTDANAAKLRDAIAPYLAHANKIGAAGRRGGRRSTGAGAGGSKTADIRAWAQANGHQVSERGRIAASVREAYEAAHA